MKISKKNAPHYIWGETCDGWHLVQNEDLSVIHERMPLGSSEVKHYHEKSRQFFFVLKGNLAIDVNNETQQLGPFEGVEVPPLTIHHVRNASVSDVEFLVISQPSTKGDRISVED